MSRNEGVQPETAQATYRVLDPIKLSPGDVAGVLDLRHFALECEPGNYR